MRPAPYADAAEDDLQRLRARLRMVEFQEFGVALAVAIDDPRSVDGQPERVPRVVPAGERPPHSAGAVAFLPLDRCAALVDTRRGVAAVAGSGGGVEGGCVVDRPAKVVMEEEEVVGRGADEVEAGVGLRLDRRFRRRGPDEQDER